jgi:hypothetical protein
MATAKARAMAAQLVASPHATEVLEALVDLDSRTTITLDFHATQDEFVPGASDRAVDEVFLEAQAKGLIVGDRRAGDGSISCWSRVRLTVAGLRSLGQWPPPGREWEPGLWGDGYWGSMARPLLLQLRDEPPPHGFYFMPAGGTTEEWASWTAALRLHEAELLSGQATSDGISTLRVTAEGHQALDARPRDALGQATAQLRSGARIDAIVTAVELGLGQRLKHLAANRDLPTSHADGHPLRLSKVNDMLRQNGAYEESDRAQVDAWLKLRNEFAHPDGREVSDARVDSVLGGIRVFLAEHTN